ncbi:amino acid decarboxylase [Streptomyces sp. PTY087I2]|uniref:amino acid decarboxylase n=1 Tax=Streptomyces sp. PTY087I2 TaxID=1819298 RepID=UPI00080B17CA|nr:amino acid decarboxylase [Streptomyces sp. PTY087I2]OCC11971.1 L-glutamyl-[BtrI acyl-carrier protein] decarboxylase [Streptomyces sp. PTY087I2]
MALTLPVHPDPLADRLHTSGLLAELAHGLGGPFHYLLPHRFDANLTAFRAALTDSGVDGRVYYAKKANKAGVFTERCAALGAGVDVASLGELSAALGHGVRGEDLVVTGPAKNTELLRVAAQQGALIAIDALGELDRVLTPRGHRPARVLLRVHPRSQPGSRFGLGEEDLDKAVRTCAEAGDRVRMEGFSFHLSGYEPQQRTDLAGDLVELCLKARALGLQADRISIGGGFAVDYVPAGPWQNFLDRQHPDDYHAGKAFTKSDFYPYHSPVSGAHALAAVLAARPAGRKESLAARLRQAGVMLLLEPGRALLDRAGSSVFTVQGIKDRDGYGVVTVDGTSLSLSEQWFNSEYLPDPLLLPARPRTAGPEPYRACVGGASCLDSDLLTWRKLAFPVQPHEGDLLVYPNTAGYQMDSNESPFHELPLPPKVVIDHPHDDTRPRWRLDR